MTEYTQKTSGMDRRQALARLGLGAAVAYSAPTILHLDRSAHAVQPSCTGKGKGKGNPWCKGGGRSGPSWNNGRGNSWNNGRGNSWNNGRR